jgi:hypothetical protein
MSFEGQTDRHGFIRARLDCGSCGRLLDRLGAKPDTPELGAMPRLWRPGNPSKRRGGWAKDSYRLAVKQALPGEFRHRWRCPCGADWQSGSYRVWERIVAKAEATGRGTVRLVAGVDV